MSNKRISELDDLPEVTSDDLAVVVDISTLSTRKASMANLKTYFQDNLPRPWVEIITLSEENITSKSFSLTNSPNLSYTVNIIPHGGCPQFINKDYIITSSTVSWDGYAWDGLLESGDILQVSYYY